jgi:MFS superfamily sulfate permease-like transporter
VDTGHDSKWLPVDFVADLTVAALVVSEGMAYVRLAGVPPAAAF